MQTLINAEKSDLFDVLSYVAFLADPKSRVDRAAIARMHAVNQFTEKQTAFVNFVLDQYETQGVDELDTNKLVPLLKLRYGDAISQAIHALGDVSTVRKVFVAFQPALYASRGSVAIRYAPTTMQQSSDTVSKSYAFGVIIVGDEILSGKRTDKHLAKVIELLAARGLPLAWAEYVGDDPARITAALKRALASNDVVFSTGGIGATPDDHTRQCAAAALCVPLALHPEAKALILERMQDVAREQSVPYDPRARTTCIG